ncbi:MAG: hypothetical protein IJS15_09030 [Victivallales bacterium]|nr:hypothetical protein [Victivallales bacterium]
MRTLKWLFGAVLLAGTSLVAQELVRNGGFDPNPDPLAGWECAEKGEASWEYIDYDGATNASAVCVRADRPTKIGVMRQIVKCRPNTSYTLRADMKSEGCTAMVTASAKDGKVLATIKSNGQVWSAMAASFVSGADGEVHILLSSEYKAGKAYAAIDNVSLKEAAVPQAAPAKAKQESNLNNIALGKPYTFSSKPNYKLCKDDGDAAQLTDGLYTKGYFWTQKSTVGWEQGCGFQHVIIDLGKVCPIGGFSVNTAYSMSATVPLVSNINIFVSIDKKEWHAVGDLVANVLRREGAPDVTKYNVYRLKDSMECHGRYVMFQFIFTNFFFTDEIEIYEGDKALLDKPMQGNAIKDPDTYRYDMMVQSAFKAEAGEIAEKLKAQGASQAKLLDKVLAYLKDIESLSFEDSSKISTIYPIDEHHVQLFALNAEYLRSIGLDRPVLWENCRWDNLNPIQVPVGKAETIVMEMMRGEVRSAVVNLMNPTDRPLDFKVAVEGLPEGSGADFSETLYTLTLQGKRISGALKPGNGASIDIKAVPGMNSQIWLSFKRPNLKAGAYNGRLVATSGGIRLAVPLKLVIYDFDFPTPRLHVGGWDYLHVRKGTKNMFGMQEHPEKGRDAMRDIYVDSPWGSNANWGGHKVGPQGAVFDAEGHLTNADKLDYSNWEYWLDFWKGARLYCVYLCVSKNFNGEKMGTPRFNNMVKEYFGAWADYVRKNNFPTEKVVLLIIDEPWDNEKDTTFITWAKPLIAAKTGFRLFEDPIHKDYSKGLPEMYALSDILCPNRVKMIGDANPKAYRDFFMKFKEQGKTLWLYSCSGPSRLLDPISYYRAQAWEAFDMGAEGTFFWAFGCGGGISDSWRPFMQSQKEYSPYFVSPDNGTMPAKQSEAIRESVQDYEYLCLLRDRIAELRKAGRGGRKLDAAEALLKDAPKQAMKLVSVKDAAKSIDAKAAIMWDEEKDRTLMDTERVKLLRMLNSLK